MAKESIIKSYEKDLDRLKKERISTIEIQPSYQQRIDEIKPPIAQLDEAIAELTVEVNKKIENISLVSIAATNCGCGKTALATVLINPLLPATPSNITTAIVPVGTTYFYEHAKTLRMNGEDLNYTGTNPFSPLSSTDGSTNFNSGIGSATIVVGSNQNSILELIVQTPGSGYASTLSPYYGKPTTGGTGIGASVDVIVGSSGASSGTVVSAIISNAGSGYKVGDILTVSGFSGASFKVTDIGSPILGVGTQTYILASSGVGSVFVQDIDTSKIGICTPLFGYNPALYCTDFNNQINTLVSQLDELRSKRQVLINGVNALKRESIYFFLQRYAIIFSRGQVDKRISEINYVITVLKDNTYDSYFT